MRYSLDTSALVHAWWESYPRDVFPTVWEKIDSLATSGTLMATQEVLRELEKQEDDLCEWLKSKSHIVVPINHDIQLAVRDIMKAYPRLVNTQTGRSQADPFVIALARVENGCVVSREVTRGKPNRPKIPDVCDNFGIPHMRLPEMFREQGVTI